MTEDTNKNKMMESPKTKVLQPQDHFMMKPKSMGEATKFAELIAKSNFIPKAYQGRPGDVLVAIQMGAELGLQPIQAIQNIAVINGHPSLWGDAVLALVKASGQLKFIKEWLSTDNKTAHCRGQRLGEPESVERRFSLEDATQAKLIGKDNWQKHPKRMLQMRARAWFLRDVFPDILKGVYIYEEAQDCDDQLNTDQNRLLEKDTSQSPLQEMKKKENESIADRCARAMKALKFTKEQYHKAWDKNKDRLDDFYKELEAAYRSPNKEELKQKVLKQLEVNCE